MDPQEQHGIEQQARTGRFRRGEHARVVVQTTDQTGAVVEQTEYDVARPALPERQHEQLVRLVTDQLPDARVSAASLGTVKLSCGDHIVTASYVDLAAAPGPR